MRARASHSYRHCYVYRFGIIIGLMIYFRVNKFYTTLIKTPASKRCQMFMAIKLIASPNLPTSDSEMIKNACACNQNVFAQITRSRRIWRIWQQALIWMHQRTYARMQFWFQSWTIRTKMQHWGLVGVFSWGNIERESNETKQQKQCSEVMLCQALVCYAWPHELQQPANNTPSSPSAQML